MRPLRFPAEAGVGVATVVAVTTFFVHLSAVQNGFLPLWDDSEYILDNGFIRSLDRTFVEWGFARFYASNWHPLTWLSHALDYRLWGFAPAGHHLTSVVIHAINAFVVTLLAMRIFELHRAHAPRATGTSLSGRTGILIAGCVTGSFFGIHPLRVESVAWVSERKDLLCGLFFLLALWQYLNYAAHRAQAAESKRRARNAYIGTLAMFVLALMSKPLAVTLPPVLLLLDWHPLRRIVSMRTAVTMVVEKLPFFALSLAAGVMAIVAQKSTGAVMPLDVSPLSTRFIVSLSSLALYLQKTLLPAGLSPYYPYPEHVSLTSPEYSVPLLVVAAITVSAVLCARSQRAWLALWAYYVVTLLPVLGILQVGAQKMADRNTYLPGLAAALLAGAAAAKLAAMVASSRRNRRALELVLLAAGAALVVSCAALTIVQTRVWHDAFAFYDRIISLDPTHAFAAYNDRGVSFSAIGRYDDAIAEYDKALAIKPDFVPAYSNRGWAQGQQGAYDSALEDFTRAIALRKDYVEAYNNRGVIQFNRGLYAKAIDDFSAAIAVSARSTRAFYNRAIALRRSGQPDRAIEDLRAAIAIDPFAAEAWRSLGNILLEKNEIDAAIDAFGQGIRVDLDPRQGYLDRGSAYVRKRDSQLAAADFSKACALGERQGCRMAEELLRRSSSR